MVSLGSYHIVSWSTPQGALPGAWRRSRVSTWILEVLVAMVLYLNRCLSQQQVWRLVQHWTTFLVARQLLTSFRKRHSNTRLGRRKNQICITSILAFFHINQGQANQALPPRQAVMASNMPCIAKETHRLWSNQKK
jgi:hypothetical protein